MSLDLSTVWCSALWSRIVNFQEPKILLCQQKCLSLSCTSTAGNLLWIRGQGGKILCSFWDIIQVDTWSIKTSQSVLVALMANWILKSVLLVLFLTPWSARVLRGLPGCWNTENLIWATCLSSHSLYIISPMISIHALLWCVRIIIIINHVNYWYNLSTLSGL